MLINCYYYAPHNHSMLHDHIAGDLDKMKDIGTDIVSLCVQESQLLNWHQRRLHNFVDMAHARGLKVHAVPNRWAGLVAGWIDGFGEFTLQNTDTWAVDENGAYLNPGRSCTQNPKVIAHYQETLKLMSEHYDFDGIIWDEPTALYACHCEHCRAACGGSPTDEWQQEMLAKFLDDVSRLAKEYMPGLQTSLFSLPHASYFANCLKTTEHIDYIGSDGHVRSEDHHMHRMKTTIFEAYPNFYEPMKNAGKKTIFLLEGQRHRDEDLQNYLDNLDAAFDLPMDQLMYYYCAHEMSPENEKVMNEATWNKIRKLSGK